MTSIGEREAMTQRRVVELFLNALHYEHLGDWHRRAGNSNIEDEILRTWLTKQGHSDSIITKVLHELDRAVAIGGGRNLYDANSEFYSMLRYGVKVRPDVGEHMVNVWLIDWKRPERNYFGIAEEVTIAGINTKRPDVVLYVNGIALGVLELKRSIVSVTEGIRQNLDSQKREFIEPFFSTVQLVMAGNDTEGLRYGVTGAPERYYLSWSEDTGPEAVIENPLDRALCQICRKDRLLELIHDFIVFDAGIKKTCRHNQYFGVKAAQARLRKREGGIIWHTQGSGKSLTMVWLAKWIRENVTNSRVLIITDRTELDDQIEKVFSGVSERIYRTKSGADLVAVLNRPDEPLICSLIQKFGVSDEGDIAAFLKDIQSHLPKDFSPKGDIYIFVDECHRTQSGKLHDAMTAIVPGAMLIGFTGTPLLKDDKQTSLEVFGSYIHTYKYDEAVRDKVVLDLKYEARDIDQHLTSPERIDQWFEAKTRGLNDVAKAELKRRWGTLQRVLSSQSRLEKIVSDILLDMETRDRLQSGHGNAILVSGSIYAACRFYELFQRTDLAGKCAVITSYKPSPADIKGEESGEGMTEKLLQYDIYRKMLAVYFNRSEDEASGKVEQFEKEAKERFINEPGQMKLLIVVDKLLTGFDAPPATYLYIDKTMRDHSLFQAICRVNRLDTADKEYGYIIDYKDLFKSLEKSITDYTGEAFDNFDKEDVEGLLKNRLAKGRERLEELREEIHALCEPVPPPRGSMDYRHFFCAEESGNAEQLKENEPKRVALYQLAAAYLRAYSELANEMEEAGYTREEAARIKADVEHHEKVRQEIKLASGDYINMKMYEPAMRHLLDTYIRAEESQRLSTFDDMSLVQLIVERGESALEALPDGIRKNEEAVAEAIENNVRKVIIDEMATNPKYYEKMSQLLDALIQARRKQAMDYKTYLEKVIAFTKQMKAGDAKGQYPVPVRTALQRALYDNLDNDEELAIRLEGAILAVKKADWRGNRFKERKVKFAIQETLGEHDGRADAIFELVKNQRDE